MPRFLNMFMIVLCLMALPAFSWAQDNAEEHESEAVITSDSGSSDGIEEIQVVKNHRTAKDNFGGWFFGGEILGGLLLGPYPLDDSSESEDDDKEVVSFSWPILTEILLNTGYLWGENVFVGPTFNVTVGFSLLVSVDLRVRVVVPFTNADAIALSAGYGFHPCNFSASESTMKTVPLETDVPDDSNSTEIIQLMYLPVSLGYEHVFDSGFVIGASIDMRISFCVHKTRYRRPFNGSMWYFGEEREKVVPYVSAIMAGLHLGYKF